MVDFGNSVFEGKLDSSVPLLNPVDDRSGETFAGALSSGIEGFNRLAFNPNAKAAQADSAKNSLFAEYAEEVSLLADAREQGMGMDEAKRHIRVAQNKFLSNNPELTDEFFTFSNKLMTENGLGGNVYQETPEESGQRKLIENGATEGWDMTNPQSIAAYKRQLNTKIYIQQLEDEAKAIEAEGGVLTAQFKSRALNGLHQLVANGTQWAMDRINAANQKLQGVTDPVMRQSIVDELKREIGAQTAVIGQTRSQTGNAIDTSYMTSGIDTMVKNFEDVATGKTTLAAITNENDTIMAKNQALILMNNPKLASLIALNKLTPFELPGMIQKLDAEMLSVYGGMNVPVTIAPDGSIKGDKPSDVLAPVEDVAKVLDLMKDTTKNIMSGVDTDPEAVKSMSNQIVNVMRSAQYYGASDNDPRNFTATVDFLSDPTVGRFIEQNGASIYPQIAAGAKQIIEQQYGEVVTGLINDRYSTAGEAILSGIGSTVDVTDVSDVVEPIWNGVGIEMVAKEQFKADFRVNQLVDDLNRGPNGIVAPLNKLIRMSAHLSGSTDYEKVYNETYKPRLWQTAEKTKPSMGQMTGKDLSGPATLEGLTNIPKGALEAPKRPDDFKETATTRKGQTGQLLDAIGAAEGATYDTMFGYAEREGGPFAGTKVTNLTLNEVAALQKEMVKNNGISSAIGKYQFIQATLKEAIKGLGLSGDEKFTPEVQDKLALWLLKNRTSFDEWVTGSGDSAKFQNELASQWASVPNTSGKSAYAGDGVNNATAEGKRLIGLL
jgi:hypothetical protein